MGTADATPEGKGVRTLPPHQNLSEATQAESSSADHTRSEPTNPGLGQLLPALRRQEGAQENGPHGLARTVEMGETPSSKEASEVGSPTVLPHRWQSSGCLC